MSTAGNRTPRLLTEGMDPISMRRRHLIAAALGLPASFLPAWAAHAAATQDMDNTLAYSTWDQTHAGVKGDLEEIANRYLTLAGQKERSSITDSSLWLYAQAVTLIGQAGSSKRRNEASRLSAECAMLAACCYIDRGNTHAAMELYSKAHLAAGSEHPDMRAFIMTQSNWINFAHSRWDSVHSRASSAIRGAERSGGYALLQGYAHYATVCAMRGQHGEAREALAQARANIPRVHGAQQPHHPLRYAASKLYFSSATAYAAMGDRDNYQAMRDLATDSPSMGWVDQQLLMLSGALVEDDADHAAHTVYENLSAIPEGAFSGYVKADADRVARRLASRSPNTRHVRQLGDFLSSVTVS